LRAKSHELSNRPEATCPAIHPAWVRAKLEHLAELIQLDPIQAKAEIAKQLEGDLTISPQPSPAREKQAKIRGCIKQNGLLKDQEAVRLQLVAGAGFEPATFGL
jgi:hypothetical protein